MRNYRETTDFVLEEISTALSRVDPETVERFVDEIDTADRVFLIGVGRVLLSLKAFAKRLNHLGVPAWCVGDNNEPALAPGDLLVAGSGSGESVIPVAISRVGKKLGARLVHIGSNEESSLAPLSDLMVRIPVRTRLHKEDEMESGQIMTSLFEQCLYLLGDVICLMLAEKRKLQIKELRRFHANLE